jgi:beta-lactam-binding protein with PASTA domain
MVAKKSSITISVSLGQVVVVPDFSKLTRDEASKVTLTNASIRFIEMYQPSTGATYGSYIWQDVKAGTKINQSSTTQLVISVYFSKGQPYLSSLVGASESIIPSTIYEFNLFSANFTYEILPSLTNAKPKGTIDEMTPYNQFVNPGTKITFRVSDGSNYTP